MESPCTAVHCFRCVDMCAPATVMCDRRANASSHHVSRRTASTVPNCTGTRSQTCRMQPGEPSAHCGVAGCAMGPGVLAVPLFRKHLASRHKGHSRRIAGRARKKRESLAKQLHHPVVCVRGVGSAPANAGARYRLHLPLLLAQPFPFVCPSHYTPSLVW